MRCDLYDVAGACLATLLLAGAAGPAYSASDYTPVTDARLANPEPANWLMTRGNYKGWSYSSLDRINTSNVKNLVPVWSFSTGVDSGHESPPIVNNGVMFVSTPYTVATAQTQPAHGQSRGTKLVGPITSAADA